MINAIDAAWHVACFTCTTCEQPFTESYMPYNGKPYCQPHFEALVAQRACAECEKVIEDPLMPLIQVMDKEWHPECFICHQCKGGLTEGYFEKDGFPACRNCFQ